MIAVIKGDIIASRTLNNQEQWLQPLKTLLTKWGRTPEEWELVWGDFFQIEISSPEEVLMRALEIKAVIKKTGSIDVRMSIGIGEKTYIGARISESNGPAFVNAGERFETLKKEKINLVIQSPWPDADKEINLYLKLAGTIMDNWSTSSAELMEIVLKRPEATQKEIGEMLGIKQNSVSGRWSRAKVDEIMEVEQMFRQKVKLLLP
ncbi:MAG: hypothetical protein GX762_08515 [Bacteroidales bacterium]|nr:hypothetical protein [Bacteroidales bacterium]